VELPPGCKAQTLAFEFAPEGSILTGMPSTIISHEVTLIPTNWFNFQDNYMRVSIIQDILNIKPVPLSYNDILERVNSI